MTTETQQQIQETDTDERESELAEASVKAVSTLFGIGRLWAVHGLGVGRSALDASASTLRSTADLLGGIAERFDDSEPGEPEPSA